MRALYKTTLFLAVSALCMGIGASLRAATIFDNSVHDLTTTFTTAKVTATEAWTYEVGDEITFGLDRPERYLTGFSFEYWGANSSHPDYFAGSIQAQVRFYVNDGPLVPPVLDGYPSPGSVPFYDSGLFSVASPTDRSTFIFTQGSDGIPDGGLFIPADHMTWSVKFTGLGLDDSVGVDIYSPPVVGTDYPDYWQNDGTGWTLLTNSVPMDFGARFYAESTVPEPSTVTLSILGGLGILTLARRLRRKA